MNVPEDLKYTESHEWVRVEGDVATVGITDHAQGELTDIVFAEPPRIGAAFGTKAPAAVIESVKAASDIYAPISGEVVAINETLSNNPALLNTDPFGAGWIFKLKIADASELASLHDAAAYCELIAK